MCGLGPRNSVNRSTIGKEKEKADAMTTGLEIKNIT